MRYGVSAALVALTLSLTVCVLLLDRMPETGWANEQTAADDNARSESPAMADNSVCYVCHANLEDERLVAVHARNEIGCTDCHGDSWDHADDEGNEIPPDIMFPVKKIDSACRECHDTHDATARNVLIRWKTRCADKDPKRVVCTDCHGKHRLAHRTVLWDRETRVILEENEKKPVPQDSAGTTNTNSE